MALEGHKKTSDSKRSWVGWMDGWKELLEKAVARK
jgi:hypothetical protein